FPGAQDDERRVDSSRGRRNQTCRMTTEPCQKNKMPQLCNAETDAEKIFSHGSTELAEVRYKSDALRYDGIALLSACI
ncbi:MAG: hypothetical protein ABSB74_13720, partial [Tepidisphaeraceae bacterium]